MDLSYQKSTNFLLRSHLVFPPLFGEWYEGIGEVFIVKKERERGREEGEGGLFFALFPPLPPAFLLLLFPLWLSSPSSPPPHPLEKGWGGEISRTQANTPSLLFNINKQLVCNLTRTPLQKKSLFCSMGILVHKLFKTNL